MLSIFRKILCGQSLARILLNRGFSEYALTGVVVDVGGGRHPDYFEYFDMKNVTSKEIIDASISGINFETDRLPYVDCYADTVICVNVLEHVYHHTFLIGEMSRILQHGGRVLGFVPFLVQYHPDPHDYFRYTKEALLLLFTEAGFTDARILTIGGGPFSVNFNNLMLSVPRFLAASLFPFYWSLDRLFLALRPAARERYPLGYIFSARKP